MGLKMLKGGKRPREKPKREIARLQSEDLYAANEQKRIIDDTEKLLSMLKSSYRSLWKTFQVKYGLPENVELNPKTGAVYDDTPLVPVDG